MNKRLLVLLLIFIILILIISVRPESMDSQARQILARYNLHPAGDAEIDKSVNLPFGNYVDIANTASKEIGMDMSQYWGCKIHNLTFLLKEKSKGESSKVYAVFFYVQEEKKVLFYQQQKEKLVGAILYSPDYWPYTSLRNREYFDENPPKN